MPSPPRPPWLARIYLAADRLLRTALRGLEAAHRGFWLGLLEPDALDAATQSLYGRSESYRDDSYNLSGLSYWESEAVDRYFAQSRRVLVAAAGGGRELIALARRGMQVDGFEPDASFVAAGQRLLSTLGLEASLRQAAPSRVPDLEGTYDGAIIGWSAYTHIPGRRRRQDFLGRIADRLAPGSPILLSFFARPDRDRALELTYRVARVSAWCARRREPVRRGDNLMVGFFHHFDEAELAEELGEIGLRMEHFSAQPYGHAIARVRAH
jgi:SAM-dependent methyltransferase